MTGINISRLKAWNFKSFKDLDLQLDNFDIIIGANSSGKSNLISIFQFIRDIIDNGVENAISLQGGTEYMFNVNSTGESMGMEIEFNTNATFGFNNKKPVNIKAFIYRIEFIVFKKSKKLKKFNESISIKNESTTMHISNANGKIQADNELYEYLNPLLKFILKDKKIDNSVLNIIPIIPFFNKRNIPQLFDIDPKLSKHAIPLSGLAELESDGNNIALVLKNLIKQPEENKKFIRLLDICMPFITKIDVQSQSDKSIIINVNENYNGKISLPATFISDGTIEIITLIYILYFEKRNIIAIEEPEKNIHPALIPNIMQLINDASASKQIILTTHSPEMVKNTNIKNILLIKRDKNGNSIVTRPGNDQDLTVFLEENINISELFIDGFLN
jgi:predicted ATPase